MDPAATESVLRHFPYCLCVVTVAHAGEEHATTASWITQAAAAPPMIAVAVENSATTIGMIRDAHRFAVSLLHRAQRELAGKLERSSSQAKLKGVKTKPTPSGAMPVLSDCLGWLECRLVTTLPAGDHTLVLGEIVGAAVEREGEPLTVQEVGVQYSG